MTLSLRVEKRKYQGGTIFCTNKNKRLPAKNGYYQG